MTSRQVVVYGRIKDIGVPNGSSITFSITNEEGVVYCEVNGDQAVLFQSLNKVGQLVEVKGPLKCRREEALRWRIDCTSVKVIVDAVVPVGQGIERTYWVPSKEIK